MGTAGAKKKEKQALEEVAQADEAIEAKKKILDEKNVEVEQSVAEIAQHDSTIVTLQATIQSKQEEQVNNGKLLEEASQETVRAEQELADFFDIRRYDTNFMSDILTLIKPKPIAQ